VISSCHWTERRKDSGRKEWKEKWHRSDEDKGIGSPALLFVFSPFLIVLFSSLLVILLSSFLVILLTSFLIVFLSSLLVVLLLVLLRSGSSGGRSGSSGGGGAWSGGRRSGRSGGTWGRSTVSVFGDCRSDSFIHSFNCSFFDGMRERDQTLSITDFLRVVSGDALDEGS